MNMVSAVHTTFHQDFCVCGMKQGDVKCRTSQGHVVKQETGKVRTYSTHETQRTKEGLHLCFYGCRAEIAKGMEKKMKRRLCGPGAP